MFACAALCTQDCTAQPTIASAYSQMTCRPYESGRSWLMLSCGSSGTIASLIGPNAATGALESLGTVQDMTVMGKKPYESFTESIFIVGSSATNAWVGFGTFDSYAAVLKVQAPCGATNFVAGALVVANLTTNDNPGGSVYFIPRSAHGDEATAEKAAAVVASENPGETGVYPPSMWRDLTAPTQPTPDTFMPGLYIPGDNAPTDHMERADACYSQYRAACRVAFTNYKNALATARAQTLNGGGSGAAVGGAAGGGIGLGVIGAICVFTGPPGWVATTVAVTVGVAAGAVVGAIAGPVVTLAEAKAAALAIFNNEMDSAFAAYIKCLEAAGYRRNPMYQ